ncbi:MAG: alcohol dehydrogenase catalytic domain-containing protein [Chloroflexi bacterium]|nr:alcohol dehydrogenase catalytic domain-containing protein [Chloroflexota bacterium]
MKALRTIGERQVEVLDLPIPHAEPGEVVIKMQATGICGSDLHPYRRPSPLHLNPGFISGHEPCGVIAEVGQDVSGWQVGDRVVPWFRRTCGQCANCRAAKQNVCSNRRPSYGHQGQDGSHCEYMRVEAPCLLRLPEHLAYLDGSIIACQGGTAYAPLVRMGVSGRDVLVVSGLGPVGLLSVLFGKAMGATIVGIDPSAGRRAIAEQIGADLTLDPAAAPVGEQLRAHVPDGADKLTETSGANSAHRVIGDLLHAHGWAALVGGGSPEFVMPLGGISGKELTIIGSSAYAPTQFDEIAAFVKRHDVQLSKVVSHQLPLEDGPEAFRIAADANSGKVCFRFD